MAASVLVCVYLLFNLQFAELASVKDCERKTKYVDCSCEDGLVRRVGVGQCFDERTSSCKSCEDESAVCVRTCSNSLISGAVKSRQRRAGVQCIFEDGIGRGKPVINTLISRTKPEGYDVSLFCNISSNPKPTKIEWIFKRKDRPPKTLDCKAEPGPTYSYSCDLCDQKLIFNAVSNDSMGNYTCVVENVVGKVSATASLTVTERPPNPNPKLTDYKMSSNSGNVMYAGRSVNLTCHGYDSNLVLWYKDGKKLDEDDLHIFHQPEKPASGYRATGHLEFKNISYNDSGAYFCIMYKGLFQKNDRSKTLNFTVEECPAGHYCSFDNNVYSCPPGFYCSADTLSPTPCPEGTFCPEGSETIGQCPSGYICPQPSVKKIKEKKPEPPNDSAILFFIIAVVLFVAVVGFVAWCVLKGRYPKLKCNSASHDLHRLRFRESDLESPENQQMNGECVQELKWDVFICYSSKDGDWVRDVLMDEIEKRGLKVCIDIRDFMPGEAIVQNIVDAIHGSRKTVAVLSPNYVKSDWCKDELQRAITLGITRHQVVPILYKPCKVPRLLLNKTYLDWTNEEVKPHFWDSLHKALQPDLRISAV